MKLHKNIYVWHVTSFFSQTAFTLPIWYLFGTQYLHVSSYKAFLLSVATYGISALFEIPTGSWADKYGRVKIFRLGSLLYLASMVSYVLTKNFYILILFQVVGALGIAMKSGTIEALVHDTLHIGKKQDGYSDLYGRNMAFLYLSRVLTVSSGAWLFTISPRLPFVMMSVCIFICLLTSLYYEEVRVDTPSELTSFNHIKETIKLVLNQRFLLVVFGISLVYRFVAESLFSLYQPNFKSIGLHAASFGLVYAFISLCSGVGSLVSGRIIKRFKTTTLLASYFVGLLLSLLLTNTHSSWLVVLVVLPSALIFGIPNNMVDSLTQRSIRSRYQSTALSVTSLLETGMFFIAVNVSGALLDHLGLNAIMNGLIVLCVIGFSLSILIHARSRAIEQNTLR